MPTVPPFAASGLLPVLLPPAQLGLAAAFVLFAALLRGLTGFGFAVAAVPLLSLILPPAQVVPIVLLIQSLGGLIETRAALRRAHRPSLTWLTVGAVAASPLGIVALSLVSADVARVAIALITAVAVLMVGRGVKLAGVPGPALTVPVGVVSGLFNGLAAMPGPPVVAYYLATPLSRTEVRATLIVFFVANAWVGTISAAWVGLIDTRTVLAALVGLPVLLLGTRLGGRLAHRGSDALHRRLALGLLGATAIVAAARGLGGLL